MITFFKPLNNENRVRLPVESAKNNVQCTSPVVHSLCFATEMNIYAGISVGPKYKTTSQDRKVRWIFL